MQPKTDPDSMLPNPDDTAAPPSSIALRRRRVGAVVFLMGISVLLTSTLLVIGGVLVFRNFEARFWHSTTGRLMDAHIDTHVGAKDPLPDVPVVKYEYAVGKTLYTSDKWSPAGYGLDIPASIDHLKSERPLTVYYNPRAPADSAVVLPPASIGFLPLVLGLGLFFILVVAIGGGTLFAALHPDLALNPDSRARAWISVSLRVGLALALSSLTGLITLMMHSAGGWWQWALTAAAVAFAVSRRQLRSTSM